MTTKMPFNVIGSSPAPSFAVAELTRLERAFADVVTAGHGGDSASCTTPGAFPRNDILSSLLKDDPSDEPTIVSDPVTGRRYAIVPLQSSATESTPIGDGPQSRPDNQWQHLRAAASDIARQTHEREQLEEERDRLAEEVGHTFEELYSLRRLALDLSACDVTTDLQTLAEDVLPNLRELIRADAIVLVPQLPQFNIVSSQVSTPDCDAHVVWIGSKRIECAEILRLTRQFAQVASTAPIVFNRDSELQTHPLQTSAHNLVAVSLVQHQKRYGWLIAIDRLSTAATDERSPSDLHSPEFGSRDVGLLTTAASMLAGHARNVELFRAEERLRLGVIETIIGALDARDPYTCGHSRRVGQYAVDIAEQLNMTTDECEQIYVTGLLHDVGKIGIADEVLLKPGRLSDEEFELIKQHPKIGHSILTPLDALSFVLPGVLHHHERVDGKGYPNSLSGDDIPLEARILAVADSFDAMTSNRSYRSGMPEERAIKILQECAGTQWDESIVEAFLATRKPAQ